MYIYQNNAFRILGLLPSAHMQEILSRANEIKVKKSLGFDVVYEYDFSWMGSLDRSDENVINALQRLEDPVSRLREEIFWFWIESNADKKSLNFLIENKRQAAHEIWKEIVDNKNLNESNSSSVSTEDSIRACLNEAILAHSSAIGREIDLKYQEDFKEQKIIIREETEVLCCPECQKVFEKEWKVCLKCGVNLVLYKNERKEQVIKSRNSNVVLNETHWKNWRFAISKFLLLNSSEIFWAFIVRKIKITNDPRLPESKIEELRKTFLLEVTKPNLEFISRALASKDYERTKWHSNLLNGLSLPSVILKDGFNRTLSSHIELLNQYSKDTKKEIDQFTESASKDLVLGVYSRISNHAKDIIYEGNLVDINCISDFALARDSVAGVLRSLSVEVHNRFHDCKKSYEIINEAIECAASSYLKQRFQKDAEAVKQNLVLSEQNKEQTTTPPKKKWNLKSIPWWVWVIGFFVLVSVFSDNKSNKISSSSRSSSSYQSTTSTELSNLKSRIINLKESVDSKETRIEDLANEIKEKENELTSLKNDIENIESQYTSQSYIPQDIEGDYNNKIEEYNNVLLPAYNDLLNQAKELYSEYQQEVATHDALVESYNKKIQ